MGSNINVSITADVADLTAKLAITKAELKAASKELNDFAAAAKGSGTGQMSAEMLAAGDNVAKLQSKVALLSGELKSVRSAASGVEAVTSGAKEAGAAMEGLHGGTSGVVRELLTLGREGASGNFHRMAGSATILVQRLGLLEAILSPVGVGLIALTAATVGVAYEMAQGVEDVTTFKNAIAGTGNAANLTASQYQVMSQDIAAHMHISLGAARDLELQLVRSGKVGSASMELMIDDAAKLGAALGEKPAEALKTLEGLTDDVSKKAAELNEQTHFLTAAQYAEIKAMEETGDKAGAASVAFQDLQVHLKNVNTTATGLSWVFQELSSHIDDGIEKMRRWGREIQGVGTEDDKLKDLMDERGTIKLRTDFTAGKIDSLDKQISDLKAKIAAEGSNQAGADQANQGKISRLNTYGHHETQLDTDTAAQKALVLDLADAQTKLNAARNSGNAKAIAEAETLLKQTQAAKQGADIAVKEDEKRVAGPKGPKPKDAGAADFENELKDAEFTIKSQTGDWSKDMQDFEVGFWKRKLDAAKEGTAAYREVLTKFEDAQLAAGQHAAEQKQRIGEDDITTGLDVQKSGIGGQRAGVEADFEASKISAQEKYELLSDLAAREAQDEIDAQEKKKALYANDVVAVHTAADEELRIRATLAAQIDQLERQLTEDKKKEENARLEAAKKAAEEEEKLHRKAAEAWKGANQEIMNSENTLVSGILSGRESMAQIALEIGHNLVEKEIENDLHYLTEKTLMNAEGLASDQATAKGGLLVELLSLGQKKAAVVSTNSAVTASDATASAAQIATQSQQVKANAGTAASGAYAAMSSIPVVGPVLAPVAAAAVYAGAMAFGGFEKGIDSVPRDMVAMIHQGERVVPRYENDAFSKVAANIGGAGGSGSKTIHNHYSPTIHAPASSGISDMLEDHGHELLTWLGKQQRKGKF